MKVETVEGNLRQYPAWIVTIYAQARHHSTPEPVEYRWQIKHAKNGRVIGASTEGYRERGTASKILSALPASAFRHGCAARKGLSPCAMLDGC